MTVMVSKPLDPDARVDMQRFCSTLDRSSSIGVGRPGGLSRLALTDADREMRDQFVTWCREAALQVRVDRVGNIFARREGRDSTLPPVLLGSHLDTQANGGRFDGVVGVLGALEVVRRLADLDHVTKRPIEIVSWSNEEGARFSPPMTASGCYAGAYAIDWVHDRRAEDGARFGDELARIGYRGEAPVGGSPDAYLELHIEQGAILWAEGTALGVVSHAYSSHGFQVAFTGETAHTGPWPMERRRNALVAAAHLMVAVDEIGWSYADTGGKATAARVSAWPNKAGTLSEWAEVVCDVRHECAQTAEVMAERTRRAIREAAARSGCEAEIVDSWSWGGRIFSDDLNELCRKIARRLGYTWRDIPSQAGHDAYFISRVCPTAMIFTPCRDGVTHHPEELAEPEDLEPGLNLLLHAAVSRADR